MKAKNNKEVGRAYLLFILALSLSVGLAVLLIASFEKTARKEMMLVGTQSLEYDKVNNMQVALTEKFDSLYRFMSHLNTSDQLNETLLKNRISTLKMQFTENVGSFDRRDVILYQNLSDRVDNLLKVCDSIKVFSMEEDLSKRELQRCIQENRDVSRRIVIDGYRGGARR